MLERQRAKLDVNGALISADACYKSLSSGSAVPVAQPIGSVFPFRSRVGRHLIYPIHHIYPTLPLSTLFFLSLSSPSFRSRPDTDGANFVCQCVPIWSSDVNTYPG
jgi:hypothetical protein